MIATTNPLQTLIHKHFGDEAPDNLEAFVKDLRSEVRELLAKREETDRSLWFDHLEQCQQIAKIGSWEGILDADFYSITPTYWSDEFFRILGYEPGTVPLSVDTYMQVVHPEDVQIVTYAFQAAMCSQSGIMHLEHRLLLHDGTVKVWSKEAGLSLKTDVLQELLEQPRMLPAQKF